MKKLIIILILAGITCPALTLYRHIEFQQNCGGYLKQAADASSIELALERLNKAISYAENSGLTEGYTSILWKTENDNVSFWYDNLKTCQQELEEALGASQLEKTNVLMKVRESLTDDKGEKGTQITIPNGISRYPHNFLYAIGNIVSCILLPILVLLLLGAMGARLK